MAVTLFRRSLALLSLAVLAAALVFAATGLGVLGSAYAKANAGSLAKAASALAATIPARALADPESAAAYARSAASSGYRVTLIAPDGAVVADSEADPKAMENHALRPEVASALRGLSSTSRRVSATIGEDLLYAASPFPAADGSGRLGGVLRLALHEPSLERAIAPSRWALALSALAFAAAALAAAALSSRMAARPLASLAGVARKYGSGEAESPEASRAVRRGDPEEIRLLAATLDSMASDIARRMREAQSQGAELEAILDAMAEAVLALDSSLRITLANPAAAALFSLGAAAAGRGLLEATRSSELQAVASECLASADNRSAEIGLFLPSERTFQVLAAPMRSRALSESSLAKAAGVVLVLGDITELRRLERVRRDFVANVSHELRTPVQMVKGFAETLEEGALDDPEQARRFVGIIARNASRMESLIDDLLSLASLEREGRDWLGSERSDIAAILQAAREAIAPKAESKDIRIELDCEEALSARLDPGLVEQALINLIDNAVKYSPPSTLVRVSARAEEGKLVIEVRDQGIGIPARDLPRVFERFYRVDKARSRELGGTGLGLAIVRHIALAHGGEASVESWEGEGSTFRIAIPMRD
jgi:two-component system phosphate regulon sensor histidine kinase PhoR